MFIKELFVTFFCIFCLSFTKDVTFAELEKHLGQIPKLMMQMKAVVNLLALILCLLLTGCSTKTESRPDSSDEMTRIDYSISNLKVQSIAEDRFGHIWIGTLRGLNKYNGYQYQQFFHSDNPNSLSYNGVNTLYMDSRKRLWVGTQRGINVYQDNDTFKQFLLKGTNWNIQKILENGKGDIYLDAMSHLYKYNNQTDDFDVVLTLPEEKSFILTPHYFLDRKDRIWSVEGNEILCFHPDTYKIVSRHSLPFSATFCFLNTNGELWLSSEQGICIFNIRTEDFSPLPAHLTDHPLFKGTTVSFIHFHTESEIYLVTSKGLFLYNVNEQKMVHQSESSFPYQVSDYHVTTLFTDSQKNLWIGTFNQGAIILSDSKDYFNHNNMVDKFFHKKFISGLTADKAGRMVAFDLFSHLYLYQSEKQTIETINVPFPLDNTYLSSNGIQSVLFDQKGYLWILCNEKDIYCCILQNNNLRIQHRFHLPYVCSTMKSDSNGNVFVSCWEEFIYKLSADKDSFEEIKYLDRQGSRTFIYSQDILPVKGGKIIVSPFDMDLYLYDDVSGEINTIPFKSQVKKELAIVKCMFQDSEGKVWIGTRSSGAYILSPELKTLTKVQGISCEDICSFEEDQQGNIWISTLYGLFKYDKTDTRITGYYASDGIGGNQFSQHSSCKLPDGTLVFGGAHGLTFFNPIDVGRKQQVPVLFEQLKVYNEWIHPVRKGIIDKSLNFNPDIRLNYNENSFSISYAALTFTNSQKVHYQYKMEGHDKYWIDASNNREAIYSNLTAGNYTFKVRIFSNDKSIVETENSIHIAISPAPWLSWWAYLIYSVFILGIILLGIYIIQRIRKEHLKAQWAEMEREQEVRTNQMHLSFFTNISHEFRTPLTMIAGPIATLCRKNSFSQEETRLLKLVQRSVNRMLKLINQIMDLGKLEGDALRLYVTKADLTQEVRNYLETVKINADEKKITLAYDNMPANLSAWIDTDKLEKILANLLSNALKFTPSGGQITVSVEKINHEQALALFTLNENDRFNQYVLLEVADTGCGIPEEKMESIFLKYYQINSDKQAVYNCGTGIGLYFVRRLVWLHHGYIKVKNAVPHGAVFTVLLPVDDEAYPENERQSTAQVPVFESIAMTDETEKPENETDTDTEKPVLLIVEDDNELSTYLKLLFSRSYHIVHRYDADSAFSELENIKPDLILSDVVMPGKLDGVAFCKKIKSGNHFCHIPVILLTAKTRMEEQIEGLKAQANAYVTKPFDPEYLKALLVSQLNNRDMARNILGNSTDTTQLEEGSINPQDKKFMDELYALMEKELSNPELNIIKITEVMKISRTKFYYKLKALTGENPSIFFRNYKLNRAAELMATGKYTISEIADMTGFSTLSFFSASFKKKFGVPPSEYKH